MPPFGAINTTAVGPDISNPPRCEVVLTADQTLTGAGTLRIKLSSAFANEVYKTNAEMHGAANDYLSVTPAGDGAIGTTWALGAILGVHYPATAPTNLIQFGITQTNAGVGVQQASVLPVEFWPHWISMTTDCLVGVPDPQFALTANLSTPANQWTVKAGSRFWLYQVA